jgi:hypothetical protein
MPFRVEQNIEIDANGGQLQIFAVASYGYVPCVYTRAET